MWVEGGRQEHDLSASASEGRLTIKPRYGIKEKDLDAVGVRGRPIPEQQPVGLFPPICIAVGRSQRQCRRRGQCLHCLTFVAMFGHFLTR